MAGQEQMAAALPAVPYSTPPRWSGPLVEPEVRRLAAALSERVAPREAGMDSLFLFRTIDSIVREAIDLRAFPGCQLFVARDGRVVIERSWGRHDYSEGAPEVENDHLYDLASVTKMAASTLALARLTDRGTLAPDDRFSKFYAPFRGTDKEKITFREVLAHQSGLPSGVAYPWRFSRDSLVRAIRDARLRTRVYRYSDLPFLLIPEVVRTADGRDFETFLNEEFYRPLGTGLTFCPLEHGVPVERIVPTETDEVWRKRTIHGTVHDESAAVMGGVSGNAGLFGTARDLGTVMQMLLDGGEFGGVRFLEPATVEMFTTRQYTSGNNRRGLGFDRPSAGNDSLPFEEAYPAPSVSQSSFGHTGFTGTFAWADPACGLVYVFLCNRVTPSRNNKAFVETRVRYALQQAVYDAMRLCVDDASVANVTE
ncbi:MAG: serine hydrolase [Alistipes sp.]|nr:serine hydrolase [Alistipes sp.]